MDDESDDEDASPNPTKEEDPEKAAEKRAADELRDYSESELEDMDPNQLKADKAVLEGPSSLDPILLEITLCRSCLEQNALRKLSPTSKYSRSIADEKRSSSNESQTATPSWRSETRPSRLTTNYASSVLKSSWMDLARSALNSRRCIRYVLFFDRTRCKVWPSRTHGSIADDHYGRQRRARTG